MYFNLGYGLNWVGTGTKSNSATYVANQEKVNLSLNLANEYIKNQGNIIIDDKNTISINTIELKIKTLIKLFNSFF